MYHQDIPSSYRHAIHNYVAANAAARLAIVVTAADVGKVCRQTDTGEFWILKSEVGPIWSSIGGGSTSLQIEWGVFSVPTPTLVRGSGAHTMTNPATGKYAIAFGSGHTFPDGNYDFHTICSDNSAVVVNSYESGNGSLTTGAGFTIQAVNGSSTAQAVTGRIRFFAVRDV